MNLLTEECKIISQVKLFVIFHACTVNIILAHFMKQVFFSMTTHSRGQPETQIMYTLDTY